MWQTVLMLSALTILYKLISKLLKHKDCDCQTRMEGKTVIVTGSNTGIGFETAKELARRGGRVILACRDERKALKAAEQLVWETGNENIAYKHLDLSSLRSVRQFAADILESEQRLDVLINNAGIFDVVDEVTEDGLSKIMQVNYLGPFLLTNLLLPKLMNNASSRVINVSAITHFFGETDLSKVDGAFSACFTSKLSNLMFSNELSRRYSDRGVISNTLDPGFVDTDIFCKISYKTAGKVLKLLAGCFLKSACKGAQTTIHLALTADLSVSGAYFRDCSPAPVSRKAQDVGLAKKMWECSEKYVKLHD